jgi:alkylation response protein AidB-like acyl-CoA dehydrogenase
MSPAATDLYVAVSYADGEGVERYAYAMVPTGAPGVVVNDDWDALGMRASGSNSVSLESVELPDAAVRGDHWIIIGHVDNLHTSPIKHPLVFFAGTFHTVQ